MIHSCIEKMLQYCFHSQYACYTHSISRKFCLLCNLIYLITTSAVDCSLFICDYHTQKVRLFEQPTPSLCDPWKTCEQDRFKFNMYRLRCCYFRSMAISQFKRYIPNLECIENSLVFQASKALSHLHCFLIQILGSNSNHTKLC